MRWSSVQRRPTSEERRLSTHLPLFACRSEVRRVACLRRLIFYGAGFEFFFDFVTYGFHWIIRCGPDGFIGLAFKGKQVFSCFGRSFY